jgi:hypothetical protein
MNGIRSSWASLTSLFALNLNRTAVVVGGTRKDHEAATWGLVFAAHQLADGSDCINDGCARRVGHETLQWFYLWFHPVKRNGSNH